MTASWLAFTSVDNSPLIAQWGLHMENRESEENITKENKLMDSTGIAVVKSRCCYFDICEKAGSAPEGGANV